MTATTLSFVAVFLVALLTGGKGIQAAAPAPEVLDPSGLSASDARDLNTWPASKEGAGYWGNFDFTVGDPSFFGETRR